VGIQGQIPFLTASLLRVVVVVAHTTQMERQAVLVAAQAALAAQVTPVARLPHPDKVTQAEVLVALLILVEVVVAQERLAALAAELPMLVAMAVLARPLLLVVLL
jgi:hypothetical protein